MMPEPLLTAVWAKPGQRPQLGSGQWEVLLGQARQGRLIARLAAHHVDHGWMATVPDGPRPHLEGGLRLADRQQHEVAWEVDCIARALRHVDAPVVLLKGAAYLVARLPAARGRVFADIDIMVPREAIDAVESALFAAGWISEESDPYNQRYYREWMHEIPPLRHVHRNTYIDLHHTITPPTSRFNVDGNRLISDAQPVKGHPRLLVLAPCDMVLHSAVHLFAEGEFGHGMRDLLDMNDLLANFAEKPHFWTELLDRADVLRLQIPLFHALLHLERLFGTTPPSHLAQRVASLGPNVASRRFMAWALGLALRPMHPSCNTRWTGLARWLLYIRSHAIRMPLHLVIPHLVRKAWMQQFPEKTK
jgi:Uncharacterised nucleotidyltransferase